MFELMGKFFKFCNSKNRNKFYISVALGVFDAIFAATKIPAAYFAIKAVLENKVDTKAILLVLGLMLLGTIGKTIINRFSQMLQTEAGYAADWQ